MRSGRDLYKVALPSWVCEAKSCAVKGWLPYPINSTDGAVECWDGLCAGAAMGPFPLMQVVRSPDTPVVLQALLTTACLFTGER